MILGCQSCDIGRLMNAGRCRRCCAPTRLPNSGSRGFSLLELMLAIAVLGVLTSIAIVTYNSYRDRVQVAEAIADLRLMEASHLHIYPFSVVKIDRSFVTDIPGSRIAMQLVRTIIRMAHGLDRAVVAEGVETQAQHDALLKFGCDSMQGYLFGKAMSGAEFLARQRAEKSVQDGVRMTDDVRRLA